MTEMNTSKNTLTPIKENNYATISNENSYINKINNPKTVISAERKKKIEEVFYKMMEL
jgi:hypothetical protein